MRKKVIGVLTIVLSMAIFGNSTFSVFAQASEVENLKTELIYQTEQSLAQIELQDQFLTNEMNSKVEQLEQYLDINDQGIAALNPTSEVRDLFSQEEYSNITSTMGLTNEMVEQGVAVRQPNGDVEVIEDESAPVSLRSASNVKDMEVKWHWCYVDLKMSKEKAIDVAYIMKEVSRGIATIGALISCLATSVTVKVIGFIISALVGTYLSAMSDTLTKKNNAGKNGTIMRIYYFGWMSFKSW